MKRYVVAVSWCLAPFLALLAIYACFPDVRLALRASPRAQLAEPGTKRVDPHLYDAEWFDAARAGRLDILGVLLDAHYPIDARTKAGYTALVLAAYDGQPKALDFLLQKGADACAADRNGNTALMGALYKGEMDIAYTLADAHCPIDQANNAGETALAFAALFGRVDIIPLLVSRGADTAHRDAQGQTPRVVALKQGNRTSVAALDAASASMLRAP